MLTINNLSASLGGTDISANDTYKIKMILWSVFALLAFVASPIASAIVIMFSFHMYGKKYGQDAQTDFVKTLLLTFSVPFMFLAFSAILAAFS